MLNLTKETVISHWSDSLQDNKHEMEITPLSHVPSAEKQNRKNYLMQNIIDRYYSHNENLKRDYFESGV